MGDYNVILEHRPGATNRADPLSHRLDFDDGSSDNENIIALPDHLFAATADTLDLEEAMIAAQKHHVPTIQAWAQAYPIQQHTDEVWWNADHLVVVEDIALRRGVTSLYHDSTTVGHPGIFKTCQLLSRDYWWPKLGEFVTDYIKGCAVCQSTKPNTTKGKPPLFPITTDHAPLPFKHVSVDLIVKLPQSQGYNSILTITDHDCSKVAFFIPCNKATDAEGMAHLLRFLGTV
jgi:hypothetical protein